jgi:AmiR/NasT family two-component response regulator
MALNEEKSASTIETFSLLRTSVDKAVTSPGQSRTLMDLVQYQSKRLQEVEQSLEQARTALEERKILERAKYILMKHRGLDEDEAYQLMRQTAMNQSRRLIEVARSLIEMSDLWKG